MHVGMAPLRISFAGGGTDMPEYYEQFGGCVISTNINLFSYVLINHRIDDSFQAFSSDFGSHHKPTKYDSLEPRHGTEIAVSAVKFLNYKKGGDFLIASDVKPGSGLGGSSTLTVNLINVILKLQSKEWSKEKIAETAFHIEREILQHPIGKQDQYIASFGGFNFIEFCKDQITVNPIKLSRSVSEELQKNLILFFVGTTRDSSDVLSTQLENIKQNKKQTMDALHEVKGLVHDMHSFLKNSDLTLFGELLNKGWLAKKKFAKGVSNEELDKIYQIGVNNGALGGKLTGAGGGGHILFYCEEEKQENIKTKLKELGLIHIPFSFYSEGTKVLNLDDFVKYDSNG